MNELLERCRPVFDAAASWLNWFLGDYDGMLRALLAFVILDCLSSAVCAIVDKKPSGAAALKCVGRKTLIFAMVGAGHILDTQVIGTGSALRTTIVFFYISSEGISLVEHARHLGLPIPKKLAIVLEEFQRNKDTVEDH